MPRHPAPLRSPGGGAAARDEARGGRGPRRLPPRPATSFGPRARDRETQGGHIATILLVEDNHDNQEIYRIILAHHGHHVLQAFDGAHGVELARSHGPDLILMDLTMPGMDGLEATRLLKADPGTAAIPVVALTACTQPEDVVAAEAAGCEGFLSKPVEPRRVAAEVRRILAGGAAEPADG